MENMTAKSSLHSWPANDTAMNCLTHSLCIDLKKFILIKFEKILLAGWKEYGKNCGIVREGAGARGLSLIEAKTVK